MKHHLRSRPRTASRSPRTGVTLTEVLVSLGIMSIGVISLATLFPLSILRTVQATQLTNATILRYHAEAFLRARSDLVFDPDLDSDRAFHYGTPVAPYDAVMNPPRPVYVVDPIGFSRYGIDLPAGVNQSFGFADQTGNATAAGAVPRFGFGAGTTTEVEFLNATGLMSLPDSWTEIVSDINVNGTITTPAVFSEDCSAVSAGDRIVFFGADGRSSEVRTAGAPTGNSVPFSPALPSGFSVSEARIETQYYRYSWLLTVRNNSDATVEAASVNVAVLFNRGLSPEEEVVYNGPNVPLPGGGTTDVVFTYGSPNAALQVPAGLTPAVKAGGYILDAANLFWYRIAKVDDQGSTIYLQLTETARASSRMAVVLPRVIDVYPIGTVSP